MSTVSPIHQRRVGDPACERTILDEAYQIVYGDREKTYGNPAVNLVRIAALWATILGVDITPRVVCLCMAAVKLARLINDPNHRDSQTDLCGYAALLERITSREPPTPHPDRP